MWNLSTMGRILKEQNSFCKNKGGGFMKKRVLTTILICMCVSVAGCNSGSDIVKNSEKSSTSSVENNAGFEGDSVEDDESSVEETIPEDMMDFYDFLQKEKSDNELSYVIEEPTIGTGGVCSIKMQYKEAPTENGLILILKTPQKKSFVVSGSRSVYGNMAPPLVKDSLIAIIHRLDESLLYEECLNIAIEFYGDYDGSGYSEVLTVGEYAMVLAPDTQGLELAVVHKDELKPEGFSEDNYTEGTINNITSPLNVGSKYYMEGELLELSEREISATLGRVKYGIARMSSTDGTEYDVVIEYQKLPLKLDIGSTYKIYGFVGEYTKGEPCLWADYIG